jgi:hypothetical protein
MPDRKKSIDEIMQATEAPIDRSLRGNALRRATGSQVPRTLTAWEWEEYYRTHGRPETHVEAITSPRIGFWQRFRTWLSR